MNSYCTCDSGSQFWMWITLGIDLNVNFVDLCQLITLCLGVTRLYITMVTSA